jgi:hypothetical protein
MSNYDKQLSQQNLANAIAVQNNQMLHEHLTKAAASVQFLVKDLQAVNNHADPLVYLLVLPLIAQAAKIQDDLDAIHTGIKQIEFDNSYHP